MLKQEGDLKVEKWMSDARVTVLMRLECRQRSRQNHTPHIASPSLQSSSGERLALGISTA